MSKITYQFTPPDPENVRPEQTLSGLLQIYRTYLKEYRQPVQIDSYILARLKKWYSIYPAMFFSAGQPSDAFNQKWGLDTPRGRILEDLFETGRPVDGGDLALIIGFFSELAEQVKE
ncbi:MAG: hypothetical protein RIG62_03510 [Cyclobacteriaceae bacterium]